MHHMGRTITTILTLSHRTQLYFSLFPIPYHPHTAKTCLAKLQNAKVPYHVQYTILYHNIRHALCCTISKWIVNYYRIATLTVIHRTISTWTAIQHSNTAYNTSNTSNTAWQNTQMHHMGRRPLLSATDAIIVPARSLFDVNAIMEFLKFFFKTIF